MSYINLNYNWNQSTKRVYKFGSRKNVRVKNLHDFRFIIISERYDFFIQKQRDLLEIRTRKLNCFNGSFSNSKNDKKNDWYDNIIINVFRCYRENKIELKPIVFNFKLPIHFCVKQVTSSFLSAIQVMTIMKQLLRSQLFFLFKD